MRWHLPQEGCLIQEGWHILDPGEIPKIRAVKNGIETVIHCDWSGAALGFDRAMRLVRGCRPIPKILFLICKTGLDHNARRILRRWAARKGARLSILSLRQDRLEKWQLMISRECNLAPLYARVSTSAT